MLVRFEARHTDDGLTRHEDSRRWMIVSPSAAHVPTGARSFLHRKDQSP